MHDLGKKIGSLIKMRRKKLHISQEKLALMADVDRSYVGRIERGEVSLTVEKLYRFAKVLDCHARDFLP